MKLMSFKKLLAEGGNLSLEVPYVDPDTGQNKTHIVAAQPMHMDPKHPEAVSRPERQNDFNNFLSSVNQAHIAEHGKHLFGANDEALKDRTALSGSTKAFMDPDIPHDEFAKHKPVVGDADVMIPREHADTAAKLLSPGKRFGRYTIVGNKNSKAQNLILAKHDDGRVQQFDFENADYDGNRPNEWSQFNHSSNWEDNKRGPNGEPPVKGAFHKLLLSAIASGQGSNGIIRGKKGDTEGFVPKSRFSVDNGLRDNAKQIGTENGKPVFRELDPKESEYKTDLPSVYKGLFGKDASPQDIQDMHSYHGLIDHMQRHFSPEQQSRIADKYIHNIYHPTRAQNIDNDLPNDERIKDGTLTYIRKAFPHHFTPEKEQEIADMKKAYYDKQANIASNIAKKQKEIGSSIVKEETGYVPNEGNAASVADLSSRGAPMESGPKKKKKPIKENITAAVGGLGFNSGNPAASSDKVSSYIETNGLAKDDENGALMNHAKLHAPLGFKAFNPKEYRKAK